MVKIKFLLMISVCFVLMISGCQSDVNTPGVLINSNDDYSKYPDTLGNGFSTSGILGVYELNIDSEKLAGELVLSRKLSIGESYIVSGTGFFNISPCQDCLKLKQLSLTPDNYLQATFAISHPFEKGDIHKPPSGLNRLDLDVFDLVLVVIPRDEIPSVYPLTGTAAYTGICVLTDGFTTELSNVTGDTTASPYFLVVDDNDDMQQTYNKFPMGTRDHLFDTYFDGGGSFDIYLTMGYGASAVKSERLNPTYYNPEFNRKSAWKVDVTPPDVSDTWNDTDNTILYEVVVEIYDWQIGANVDPELGNPDDVYAASEVSSVSVEIPGMTNTLPSQTSALSGSGMPDDPLIYSIEIANENLLTAGEYVGLVKVADSRVPPSSSSPFDVDTLVDAPDGINLNWYDIPEFATYQTFTAIVVAGADPPQLDAIDPDQGEQDTVLTAVLITGSNFDIDAEVTLQLSTGGSPIDADDEIVDPSGDLLTCTLDLDSGVFDTGLYDLRVTNPGSGLSGVLEEGFEVLEGGCQLVNGFTFVESLNGGYGSQPNGNYDICASPWADELFMITNGGSGSVIIRYIHAYPDTDPVNYFSGSTYSLGTYAPVNGVEPVYNEGSAHPYCICILRTASQVVSTYEFFPSTHTFTYLGDAGISAGYHRAGCSDPDSDTMWVLYSDDSIYEFHQLSWGAYQTSFSSEIDPPFLGSAFDMVYCKYDSTIILFTDNTTGGTLYKIDPANGDILDSIENILPGTGHNGQGDIVIDNSDDNELLCRLVVLGGDTDINMTRVLADFSDTATFTFTGAGYGVNCAALSIGNHRLFIKEYGRPEYVDIYDPPIGW